MDKCPACKKYSLDYDVFEGEAICSHNGCSYKKIMREDEYIIKYADRSRYVLLPAWIIEKIKEQERKSVAK